MADRSESLVFLVIIQPGSQAMLGACFSSISSTTSMKATCILEPRFLLVAFDGQRGYCENVSVFAGFHHFPVLTTIPSQRYKGDVDNLTPRLFQ